MRSLRAAAALCLASPIAGCVLFPDGRSHVLNEPYRARFGAHTPAVTGALAEAPGLLETRIGPHTVTLALTPVREDETNVVSGVLVCVVNEASGKAAAQLDAFRYTLSHDFLSPLRTLQEMARILDREHSQHLPPEASIFLGHLSQGTNKLADRMEALIRYVRLDSQPLNCHRVDVSRLVSSVIAELRAVHGDKAHVVVGELPDAYADADLTRQLFTAVLSNAFKFGRNTPEPRIEIGSAMSGGGQNTYFVVDNGAGFEMKYAGKLFGLFQRMHGEAQFEGTGADLAIAKRIVERHGGTMRAEAMKDQGARFFFTLTKP
jgi:light-regulated signal transduction histidine kinase (bacteriophytochrome)